MLHTRAWGTPNRRARRPLGPVRTFLVTTAAALAVTATAVPATAAPGEERPKPTSSAWGRDGEPEAPPVKAGKNRPPKSVRSAKPTKEERAWAKAQETRRSGDAPTAKSDEVAPLVGIPEGQGEVPWHEISDLRLTDSLVARVNYSNGNLMLAATDFDIAGAGQNLQLTRTHNSFIGAYGQVSDRWWSGYERKLWLFTNSAVLYDDTGATVSFYINSDGGYDTPDGYSLDLKKNSDGTYTLTDRKSGSKDHFSAAGELTKVVDRNGGTITVDHHETADGRNAGFKLTETRSGRWIDLVEVDEDHWEATDSAGRTVEYHLDADGNLVRTVDTEGRATAFGYDADGRVTEVTTPEGRKVSFTYGEHDEVTSLTRGGPGGPTWTYSYSADYPWRAGTTTVTDPDGDETVYHHNGDGEVTKVTDPLGHERSRSYDAHMVVSATDAMGTGTEPGNTTAYGWDARNNPTSAKLPTGATASLTGYQTIAGTDLPGTLTTPDGNETDYTYDNAGNTLSVAVTGEAGGTREFTYQGGGTDCGGFEGQRCTATDQRGKTTHFTYDAKGNLTKAAPPAPMGATTYRYDDLGRPVQVTDGRGRTLHYTYDDRDRVIEVDDGVYDTVTFTYDDDGNRTARTDATGTTTWSYDALGRETIRTLADGSATVLSYTADGQVDTYTDPTGTVDYTWDAAGRLTELTDPAGAKTTYTHNNNGERTKTVYPGGTTQSVELDGSGRPTRITATSGEKTLIDLSYSYIYGLPAALDDWERVTDINKITSRTDHVSGKKITYRYDSAARLHYAQETRNGERTASWLYCFDAAGNLTSQSGQSSTCPSGNRFTYNDASQLTARNGDSSGWSYDKAGHETSAVAASTAVRTKEQWNAFSQLKLLTVNGTQYDAEYAGTTGAERTRFGATTFHHGPLGLAAQTTAGKDSGFVREPTGTLNSMRTGGKSYYYLTDALGSVMGLVDASGERTHTYDYGPTGLPRTTPTETVPQPYRFTGTYLDPTGLYKMGARYYDPHLGRFTQPDPSGQETNPYLYATGDPVNNIDPTGLLGVPGWVKKAGRAFKPSPGYVLGCYVSNSVTDSGPEDGGLRNEIGDLGECANPFSGFVGD
ncbi:RHS repeat-associated core domain-containing protein [Streptomyces chitinivorans]|uniref:RHS repeat-associated core domain-containing protein n=1 Tax=Streptomyces chitinivorans TaxID=1257027 RepID=A0ABW7HQM9_9ACTN|nr:RHS repeat-associated core domain-containing protein [Streptomyces chitinivorans]MDH2407957.1 RHS repeat-associated core domain-containing protein [Streptomyces chitinivorans]